MERGIKFLFGVGVNDADYAVHPQNKGVRTSCPFYLKWKQMLERCYDHKFLIKNPAYKGCSVCDEWLIFSNFKSWMEGQDWAGKELDKDIIKQGNKLYCPEFCCFVDKMINQFFVNKTARLGVYPLGVSWHKHTKKFTAVCSDPISKKKIYLGYYDCQQEAHEAWLRKKHEISCALADLQQDKRVADSLRSRYL